MLSIISRSILTSNQSKVVGWGLLMKEIWRDDGVFVITRNVDVFDLQTPEEIKR